MTVDQIYPLEFKTSPSLQKNFSRPLLDASRLSPSDELELIVDPVVLDLRHRLIKVLSRTESVSGRESIGSNRYFINRETFIETHQGDLEYLLICLQHELRCGLLRDFEHPFIVTRIDTPVVLEEVHVIRKSLGRNFRVWFQLIQSPDNYSTMIFGDLELWTRTIE